MFDAEGSAPLSCVELARAIIDAYARQAHEREHEDEEPQADEHRQPEDGEEPGGACLDRADRVLLLRVHREDQHRELGPLPAEIGEERDAARAGQVDVEDADIGLLGDKYPLAALRIAGFQDGDFIVPGEQRTAARNHDRMIIDDQNAHRHWSKSGINSCCAASD